MLGKYNENFKRVPSASEMNPVLSPGDENFDMARMLYDEYFVYDDAHLILAAPEKNVTQYEWFFTDPLDDNKPVSVVYVDTSLAKLVRMQGTTYKKRVLSVYVPESNLETGKTYKLTLRITDKGGNTYTDSCGVIIYSHFDR